MEKLTKWLLTVLMALGVGLAVAQGTATAPTVQAASAVSTNNRLEVFVRDGCPHCAHAKVFLSQLALTRPSLNIVYRQVDQDERARDDLIGHTQRAGVWPPGVPTFVWRDQVLTGFDDANHAGKELLALLDSAATAPDDALESSLFGRLSAASMGLPLFTLVLGLLDGINPCAMWVLLFLLSLLVHLHDRRRMALVAGTFVLVSGAVYYAFMAAWLNVFLAVGLSDLARWLLAAVALIMSAINLKDFVAWGRGPSLSIPEAAKPGLYQRMRRVVQAPALPGSLLAVAALAVVVNFVELLCTAGIPAVYTAVLTQQQLSAPAHYGYLGLYIAGYIADDALMVATAVFALGSQRLSEKVGRSLKLVSGGVMLVLGLLLLLRPQWLM
jgi:hypothetical protein